MVNPMGQWLGWIVFVIFATATSSAQAETALTVQTESNETLKLSVEELLHFPQAMVATTNDFIDGVKKFRGPLARDLLTECGPKPPKSVTLTAANDYQIKVQTSEWFEYNVIFALSEDGNRLSRRDKGPIWLIYPMSEHPELRDPVFNGRLIWQLTKMECR